MNDYSSHDYTNRKTTAILKKLQKNNNQIIEVYTSNEFQISNIKIWYPIEKCYVIHKEC